MYLKCDMLIPHDFVKEMKDIKVIVKMLFHIGDTIANFKMSLGVYKSIIK